MKRLFKSTKDKILLGICGGVGEYLNVDATAIRVIFAIAMFFGGLGLWAYLVCALIMTTKPDNFIEAQ